MKIWTDRFPKALKGNATGLMDCIQAFEKALSIEKVLLFGSYARGDNRHDSDVDLCVIVNGAETQQAAARMLRRAVGRIRNKPALSLVPISPERLAEKHSVQDPFYETILKEGVCLAEKN